MAAGFNRNVTKETRAHWYQEFAQRQGITLEEMRSAVDMAVFSQDIDYFPKWGEFKSLLNQVRGTTQEGQAIKGCQHCDYGRVFIMEYEKQYGMDIEKTAYCGACKSRPLPKGGGRYVMPGDFKPAPDFNPGAAFQPSLPPEESKRRIAALIKSLGGEPDPALESKRERELAEDRKRDEEGPF